MDILAASIATVASPPIAAATVPTLGNPDALAAARFAAIMAPPPEATPMAVGTAVAPTVTESVPTTGVPTSLGDRILSGMNGVSSDLQGAWKNIAATLNTDRPLNTQDMLKMQMHLSQVSVQYDLVGKAISRSTQNIDQLVRVQ